MFLIIGYGSIWLVWFLTLAFKGHMMTWLMWKISQFTVAFPIITLFLSFWAYLSYGTMNQVGTSWFGTDYQKIGGVVTVTTASINVVKADKKYILFHDKAYTTPGKTDYTLASAWGMNAYDHNWTKNLIFLYSVCFVSLFVSRLVWVPFREQYFKNNDTNYDKNGCNSHNTDVQGEECVYEDPLLSL